MGVGDGVRCKWHYDRRRPGAAGAGRRLVASGWEEARYSFFFSSRRRHTRCAIVAAVAAGRAVSADLGADASRARRAAVVAASCEVGEDAHTGEEPVAGAGVEPGRAAEMETVECSGEKATGRVTAAAVGQPAESGVAGAARPTVSLDQRTGPGGSGAGQHTPDRAAIDDPSGCGADHGAGLRADRGASAAISPWKAGGQLLRVDSLRAFQWRAPTAVGAHQQAGQYFSARVAGGSSAERGAA